MDMAAPELLSLWKTPGIGPQRLRNLLERFKNASAVYSASTRQLVEVDGIDHATAAKIKSNMDLQGANAQIRRCKELGIDILTLYSPHYPPLLKPVYDLPIVLFVYGDVTSLKEKSVAIVGTRSPSEYGKVCTQKLSRELVQQGLLIVSGLARGIDTIAHHETIAQGGKTIAVLGSGIDHIYPGENRRLARLISEQGVLVSEYPPGTKPDAPHFPRRNRIIAGLSLATLVIEAGESSGALITAYHALEYNREVMAVPGNITNPKSWGCNRLIQQGAKLVQGVEDILIEIGMSKQEPQAMQMNLSALDLTDEEEAILQLLSDGPQHVDTIARSAERPVAQTLSVLLQLELKNLVSQLAGKQFVRI